MFITDQWWNSYDLEKDIYNIGTLSKIIEDMWWGDGTGRKCEAMPSVIFDNVPILFLSCYINSFVRVYIFKMHIPWGAPIVKPEEKNNTHGAWLSKHWNSIRTI